MPIGAARRPFGALPGRLGRFLLVTRWVLPFLERHLAGNEQFAAFFAPPAPPGATVTAVP